MPETQNFLRWFVPLGIGGALAVMIFWFYRIDAAAHTKALQDNSDQWKGQAEALVDLVKDSTAATIANTKVTEAAAASTKSAVDSMGVMLDLVIRRLNGGDWPRQRPRE